MRKNKPLKIIEINIALVTSVKKIIIKVEIELHHTPTCEKF